MRAASWIDDPPTLRVDRQRAGGGRPSPGHASRRRRGGGELSRGRASLGHCTCGGLRRHPRSLRRRAPRDEGRRERPRARLRPRHERAHEPHEPVHRARLRSWQAHRRSALPRRRAARRSDVARGARGRHVRRRPDDAARRRARVAPPRSRGERARPVRPVGRQPDVRRRTRWPALPSPLERFVLWSVANNGDGALLAGGTSDGRAGVVARIVGESITILADRLDVPPIRAIAPRGDGTFVGACEHGTIIHLRGDTSSSGRASARRTSSPTAPAGPWCDRNG